VSAKVVTLKEEIGYECCITNQDCKWCHRTHWKYTACQPA